jgi:glutaredoxin-like protein NrdH
LDAGEYPNLSEEEIDRITDAALARAGLTRAGARRIEVVLEGDLDQRRDMIEARNAELPGSGRQMRLDAEMDLLADRMRATASQATGRADAWDRYAAFARQAEETLREDNAAAAAEITVTASEFRELLERRRANDPNGADYPDNVHLEDDGRTMTYEDDATAYRWASNPDGTFTLASFRPDARMLADHEMFEAARDALAEAGERAHTHEEALRAMRDDAGVLPARKANASESALLDEGRAATARAERMFSESASLTRQALPQIVTELLEHPWDQGSTRRAVTRRTDLTLRLEGLPPLDALRNAGPHGFTDAVVENTNDAVDRDLVDHAWQRHAATTTKAEPAEIIDPQIDPADARIIITTEDGTVLKSDTDVHLASMLADHELGEGWENRKGPTGEHWDFEEYLDVVGDHAQAIPAPPAEDEPAAQEQPPAITIYTTPSCPGCGLTKEKLTEAGIPFEAVDLSTRPDLVEAFKAEGLMSAPIIQTPDGTRTAGFRPDRIKAIIAAGPTGTAPHKGSATTVEARRRADAPAHQRGQTL